MRRAQFWTGSLPVVLCMLAGPAAAADDDAAIRENARKRLPKASLSIEDAIARAIKKHPDGRAVQATLEIVEGDDDGDLLLFEVKIVEGERQFEVEIDGATGNCDGDVPIGGQLAVEKLVAEAVAKTKFTLAQAIGAAIDRLNIPGTRAFDARTRLDDGKLVYSVGLLAGQDVYDARIDGLTGKLLAQKKVK